MAARDERSLESFEVLDDPVVDHGGHATAVHVGMRVHLGRAAVGRPARVPDPCVAVRRMGRDDCGEVVELSFRAKDLEGSVFLHRDARGVIPAVLEASKTGHQEWQRLARPDVADDPAHA